MMLCVMMFCGGCATVKPNEPQQVLKLEKIEKGAPAPYAGYLANDATVEEIDAALIDLEDCENKQTRWWEKPLAGVKGFFIGLLVGYAAAGVQR